MDKQNQLKDLAQRAIDSAKQVEGAEKQRYMDVAKQAMDELKKLQQAPVQSAVPTEEASFLDKTLNYLESNLDLPAGLAGAGLGFMAAGPVGAIIGGAGGTFAGTVASDVLTEEEIDYSDAVANAGISIGIDVATLGLGKVASPIIKALYAKKVPPEEAVKILAAQSGDMAEAGSKASIAQSQATLAEGGATLTASQTLEANSAVRFAEAIAREGSFSRGAMQQQSDKVAQVVTNEFNNLFSVDSLGRTMSSNEVGQAMSNVINQGKKALSQAYVSNLGAVTKQLTESNVTVNSKAIKNRLTKFVDSNKLEGLGSKLDDATLKVINDTLEELPDSMKATTLIEYEKKLMNKISQLGTFGTPNYNSVASEQLAKVSNIFRKASLGAIAQQDVVAAKMYSEAKGAYAKGLGELFPEINKNMIKQAGKGNFQGLGSTLTKATNVDQVKAVFGSIRAAYKEMTPKQLADMPFKTADEAVQAVRESYMAHLFKTSGDGSQSLMSMSGLSKTFDNPANSKQLKAVMGEHAPTVKRLMNLINDASKKPESSMGTLLLRSKEYAVLAGAVGFGSGAISPEEALGTGIVAIGLPRIFAALVTNPKAVNKLIAMNSKKFSTTEGMFLAFNDILVEFAPEIANEINDMKPLQRNEEGDVVIEINY